MLQEEGAQVPLEQYVYITCTPTHFTARAFDALPLEALYFALDGFALDAVALGASTSTCPTPSNSLLNSYKPAVQSNVPGCDGSRASA